MSALLLAAWMAVAPAQDPNRTRDTQGTGSQTSGQASGSHAMWDGTWQVVYAEKDGQRMETGASQNVTIRDGTLMCSIDGKQKTFRLRFGPNYTVWATEVGGTGSGASDTNRSGQTAGTTGGQSRTGSDANRGGTSGSEAHQGVYIPSQEYLCFAFQHAGAATGGAPVGRTGAGTESGTTGSRTGATGGTTGTGGQFHRPGFVLILHKSPASK
jgi:hypothetical protein